MAPRFNVIPGCKDNNTRMSVSGYKAKRLVSLPYFHAIVNFESPPSWTNTSCPCVLPSEIQNGGLSNSAINLRDRTENNDIVNSQKEKKYIGK